MIDKDKNELKGSFLESIDKKELEIKAPDGYFDSLADSIIQEAAKPISLSLLRKSRIFPLLSMAASMALVVACILLFSDKKQTTFDDLTNDELMDYAISLEFDDDDLLDMDTEDNAISALTINEINEHLENDIDDLDIIEITEYL